MKIYIDFNIEKRKNATDSFEKKNFNLMINSVYCKTGKLTRKNRCYNSEQSKRLFKTCQQTKFYFYKTLC